MQKQSVLFIALFFTSVCSFNIELLGMGKNAFGTVAKLNEGTQSRSRIGIKEVLALAPASASIPSVVYALTHIPPHIFSGVDNTGIIMATGIVVPAICICTTAYLLNRCEKSQPEMKRIHNQN